MKTSMSLSKMLDFSISGQLSPDELAEIKSRITAFELNKGLGGKSIRNGGSELKSEVAKLDIHIGHLVAIVDRIKNVLAPSQRSRTTLSTQEAQHIHSVAALFLSLPEAILRQVAQTALGDAQLDFTLGELPYALALKQVRNLQQCSLKDIEEFLATPIS